MPTPTVGIGAGPLPAPPNPYAAPDSPLGPGRRHAPGDGDARCRWYRALSLVALLAFAALLADLGSEGWGVNSIPAEYLGLFVAGGGILGLVGVNIRHGGPLDRRLDRLPGLRDD